MNRKRCTPEQIIGMLQEAEVRLSQGQSMNEICQGFGVSDQSYYRLRREYKGKYQTDPSQLPYPSNLEALATQRPTFQMTDDNLFFCFMGVRDI